MEIVHFCVYCATCFFVQVDIALVKPMLMYAKILKKSRFLILLLLLMALPAPVQATESTSSTKDKEMVVPTLAFKFLSNRLMNLSDTKQSGSLFVTICKLKNAPETLTKEEKQKLSQYVNEETIQLGKELAFYQGQ